MTTIFTAIQQIADEDAKFVALTALSEVLFIGYDNLDGYMD